MNAASLAPSSPGNHTLAAAGSLAMQLEALRSLLASATNAIGSGDVLQVQAASEELTQLAVNLRPAWGELFPDRNSIVTLESEQRRQRLVLPLLEARAHYLAALRRWRRSLRLRRSLLEMRMEAPDHVDELSRWC